MWIEGPHIIRTKGHYYLTAAEGGTSVKHSQVVFRADRVDGPYVPAPVTVNPILTQRDLDPRRPAPITSAGHADLLELADGSWWATFLATRPYAGDLYNTGRETFLLPVTWRDGWPIILPRGAPIPTIAPLPALPRDAAVVPATTGSFTVRDDFDRPSLAQMWIAMRGVAPARIDRGELVLPAAGGIGDHARPSFVGRRQSHSHATVTTRVRFDPAEGDEAGLAAVQDDDHFLGVGVTRQKGRLAIRAFRRGAAGEPAIGATLAIIPIRGRPGSPIRLRIAARGGNCDLDYALGSGAWSVAAHGVDGTILSTAKAGGFTGTVIGPFARAAR